MHKKNNQNQIKILGRSFDRNNIYKFFWSLNLVFVLGYMSLSYFTVSNIIERKQIATNIEDLRAEVGTLESKYFTKMSDISDGDKITEGYSEPENVSFATIKSSNAVSLANTNGL